MSRSRKRRSKGQGQGQGGRRGRSGRKPPPVESAVGFWGDPGELPPARTDVRITDDPSATVRSLGAPPLPGHEAIAEHYFAAVYDRAVTLSGALAAVGGLIEPEELTERDDG